MNEHTRRPPPTREQVLAYLEENPNQGSKREIARALRISGDDRVILREILSELEAEGALARTGKRDFQPVDTPPPTGIVAFERVDAEGDLVGRCVGRDGLYGPDIIFAGTMGKGRQIALGVGERALCRISKSADGVWKARALNKIEVIAETTVVGLYRAKPHGGGELVAFGDRAFGVGRAAFGGQSNGQGGHVPEQCFAHRVPPTVI